MMMMMMAIMMMMMIGLRRPLGGADYQRSLATSPLLVVGKTVGYSPSSAGVPAV